MLKPTPNFPVLNGSSDLLREKTRRQLVDTTPESVYVKAQRPPPNSMHLLRSSVLMCSKSLSVNTASLPMTSDGHCKRRTLGRREICKGFWVVTLSVIVGCRQPSTTHHDIAPGMQQLVGGVAAKVETAEERFGACVVCRQFRG